MKSNILIISAFVIIAFFLANCGGGETSNNGYLGKLPDIAKNYGDKMAKVKKEIKECTDLGEVFKLTKEKKLLGEEADKAVEEYLASNPITDVPFEQKADYRFKIKKIAVDRASDSRINFRADVLITKDIRNSFGNPPGFSNSFFAYMKAVDKDGNSLTRKSGVMMNSGSRGPFKAGMEVKMSGSLDGPADLSDFEKLVFISKKEYRQK
ncbi:MAG: hypothetical protein GXO77_16680 [Calditrichaeota bacterium]|nr:hypothetical protein [Calditrichota bacterium]